MRTTIKIAEDALLLAKRLSERQGISLGEAVSQLIRRGASPESTDSVVAQPLRGRFALLPVRDEVITPEFVRDLLEQGHS